MSSFSFSKSRGFEIFYTTCEMNYQKKYQNRMKNDIIISPIESNNSGTLSAYSHFHKSKTISFHIFDTFVSYRSKWCQLQINLNGQKIFLLILFVYVFVWCLCLVLCLLWYGSDEQQKATGNSISPFFDWKYWTSVFCYSASPFHSIIKVPFE